ncbi:hypothetical protein pipiens_007899 [Culex pipiens pipiens]|uniref:Medium-chain acyl-CoA ligase ACSF2, mitochondrial n=1 Tax=Culex pipiens pipiens TaxID=38569 RepID=A0ABD1DJV0_CULPP
MVHRSILCCLVVALVHLGQCSRIVPPLYRYDDYFQCQRKSQSGVFCFVKVVLSEQRQSFDSPRLDTSFRHDLLDWGVCVSDCQRELADISTEQRQRLFLPKFQINFTYILPADHWGTYVENFKLRYGSLINVCVNHRLEHEYNLSKLAYSEIEYCSTRDELDLRHRKTSGLVTVAFYATVLMLIGFTAVANLVDLIGGDQAREHIIVSSFSIRRNWARLTDQPKSVLYRDFGYIDGLRVCANFYLIIMHIMIVTAVIPVGNPEYSETILKTPLMINIMALAPTGAQLFFVIGGLLLVTTVLQDISQKPHLQDGYFRAKICSSDAQYVFMHQPWFNHVYIPSYTNMNSYLAGMIVGYLYHHTKYHRLNLDDSMYEIPRSSWLTVLHNILYHNAAVITLSVCFIECFRNPPGRVRAFLSSPAMTSLGKLVYCVYVLHFTVMRLIVNQFTPEYTLNFVNVPWIAADRLAAAFYQVGLERGDRVAIWAPNCSAYYLATFAVARAGMISMGLNPAFQLPELEYALNKNTLGIRCVRTSYGMTETTGVAFLCDRGNKTESSLDTVGRIMDHYEAKVVDSEGKIVSFGMAGELLIRGYGIMLGYWGDDLKTKQILGNDGWLRTGDQFVLQPDEYGQIVGRIKEIIIRGGENIYPKEVEDVLNTIPEILESYCIGVPDERLGEEVCAYVRLVDTVECKQFDIERMKLFCQDKLAYFKIPKHLRIVEEMPKTSTGKIQKMVLLKMFLSENK